jgi:hypothetical protein
VLAGEPAPDRDPPRLAGDGSAGDPVAIPSLPFGDGRDTRRADGTGASVHYRLELHSSTKLRGFVIDRRGRHALHVQTDPRDPATRVRADLGLGARLTAGTYYLVVDARAPGEYLLALTTTK